MSADFLKQKSPLFIDIFPLQKIDTKMKEILVEKFKFKVNSWNGWLSHARSQSGGGGQGVRTPLLKNYKNIGCLGNTVSAPLKSHKTTKPAFNVGPSSALKWRFAGGPMTARLHWYLDPYSPHQLKKQRQSWTPLTKLPGYAHVSEFENC